ncbi:MAG TPA: glucosaminidase domain-containing protein, partial [Saprospiraceae bacterium]|nr:glucosaminidase domain-containing protein [Saprospiraceae bacterium]
MGKSLVFCLLHGHIHRLWLGLFLLSPFITNLLAQDTDAYIRNFKDIAVAEMLRTGIPASIKLAQAMVESNCGTSELACKANNHFGIKCGGDWCGKTFRKEDDDYKDGELTKSCFREFKSPLESYVAHSDFLTDPKKATRYGPLFQLKPTDYKAWAYGLLKAGYA